MDRDITIKFIFSAKHDLKQKGIDPSEWRRRISQSFLKLYIGTPQCGETFSSCWNELENKGLLQ